MDDYLCARARRLLVAGIYFDSLQRAERDALVLELEALQPVPALTPADQIAEEGVAPDDDAAKDLGEMGAP